MHHRLTNHSHSINKWLDPNKYALDRLYLLILFYWFCFGALQLVTEICQQQQQQQQILNILITHNIRHNNNTLYMHTFVYTYIYIRYNYRHTPYKDVHIYKYTFKNILNDNNKSNINNIIMTNQTNIDKQEIRKTTTSNLYGADILTAKIENHM